MLLELLLSKFPLLQLLLRELLLDELHDELLQDIELLMCILLQELHILLEDSLQLLYEQHDDIKLEDKIEHELQGHEQLEEQLGLL